MIYSPLLIDHFNSPRMTKAKAGTFERTVVYKGGQTGDFDSFLLTIELEGEKVVGAYFKALGCPYLIALLSYLCEIMKGATLSVLKTLNIRELVDVFEVPRTKWYVVMTVLDSFKDEEQ